MNSWKTVNFTKQYGAQRILFLSSLTMVLCFIIFYVSLQYLSEASTLSDNYFVLFAIALLMIYPFHKLFHFLPIAHLGDKLQKTVKLKYGFIPNIQIKIREPISKRHFLLALSLPFLMINTFLIVVCFFFPQYIHYFTMLLAFHVGICLPDMICAKNVITAPARSYIEENDDGIAILLRNN